MLKPNETGKVVFSDKQQEIKAKLAKLKAKKNEPVTLVTLNDKLDLVIELLQK